jgi:hypothetical protein
MKAKRAAAMRRLRRASLRVTGSVGVRFSPISSFSFHGTN